MRHLNYTHLLYFWTVAREGSIARAAETLHLTPQTISGQLKLLEGAIGQPLFNRVGRGLVLSETGQLVNQYADEIFSLGAELTQRVRSDEPLMPNTLNVGIVNAIPKLAALKILEPVYGLEEEMKVVCREADLELLLGELAVHRLDLVISDRPMPSGMSVKAYNHELGQSDVQLFAHRSIARQYKKQFPASLDRAPFLLPLPSNPLRSRLDSWFEEHGIQPRIIAEFDDSALLKAFGQGGHGVYPASAAIAGQVADMYQGELIGAVEGVKESFYAISPERKLKHPAVMTITESARQTLFEMG